MDIGSGTELKSTGIDSDCSLSGMKLSHDCKILFIKLLSDSGISIETGTTVGSINGLGKLSDKSYVISSCMICGSIDISDKSNLKKLMSNSCSTTFNPTESISLINSICIMLLRESERP